jgi:hypothetical protein
MDTFMDDDEPLIRPYKQAASKSTGVKMTVGSFGYNIVEYTTFPLLLYTEATASVKHRENEV